MSRVVNRIPNQRGRPCIYPWEKWMDGRTRKLVHEEDFFSDWKSFRVLVHRTASIYGLKAKTEKLENGRAMLVMFYEEDEND